MTEGARCNDDRFEAVAKKKSRGATVKPFVRVIDLDVFRRSVVFMCGSLEELDKAVKEPSKHYSPHSVKVMSRTWPGLRRRIADDIESSGAFSGLTSASKDESDVYIWMPEWDSSTLVHEMYHAVSAILRRIGTQDEETGAYLISHLFRSLVWVEGDK